MTDQNTRPQPSAEPVAWMYEKDGYRIASAEQLYPGHDADHGWTETPLYPASALEAATGWQPIETAPKDEAWVWLFGELNGEQHGRLGFWGEGDDWFDSEAATHGLTEYGWQPTHWKPLDLPADAIERGEV